MIVNGISHNELDFYWEKFLNIVNLPIKVIEIRDVIHNIGFVEPIHVGNVYFVGVAGGFIDDMFGFATVNSIISGVAAARSILNNENYDEMMKPIKDDIKRVHEFRTLFNTWDNKTFEKVLKVRGLPIVHQAMYNNPLFKITQLSFLAKLQNNHIRKTKFPR